MNRPGTVPQSLRGIPSGFGAQQQAQQAGRSVSNRLPNGKLGGNASGWAFGAGVPMGGGGLQNQSRQLGGNLSFAQSLSGSQPATPLDLSEFPSLSNSSQLPTSGQSSMWSTAGSRNVGGGPAQRNQGAPLTTSSQQNQQEDFFTISRMSSNPGSFRFGGQSSMSQSSQAQSSAVDDFPPLNRSMNGDPGQGDRTASLMSTLGFGAGAQGSLGGGSAQSSRAGNGLLNALSANSRSSEVRSPTSGSRVQDGRSSLAEEEAHQKPAPFREEGTASQASLSSAIGMGAESRNRLGAIGNDAPGPKVGDEKESRGRSGVQDPLEGMAPIDKWGLKGLRTLMNNYPDYHALVVGIDPSTLGLDLSSSELISTQEYSLFDDVPPRPVVPKYQLPDCYRVTNVQPIENKIQSFNEETLMWIFYSCPRDVQQQLAAIELNNRNWRWHKKLQLWLTKDDMMTPQVLSPLHERGYYIVWDTENWRKERRELTLTYSDLDNPGSA